MYSRRLASILGLLLLLAVFSSGYSGNRFPALSLSGNQAGFNQLFAYRFSAIRSPSHISSLPVLLVTSTSDAGPGSLRQAIIDANNHVGGDSIVFNIPTSDPGYNSLLGVWTIKPLTPLPTFTDDGTVIDGESQSFFSHGASRLGPAIELDGSLGGPAICGLQIWCSWTFVHNLAINRMSEMGIYIGGVGHSFNLIDRCYIGVTPDGKSNAPNLQSGIVIAASNLNFISWPDTTFPSFANVIGGNSKAGIEIWGKESTLNYIGPNCIGTDLSGTVDLGNAGDGIFIYDGAADNAIMNFDFPHFIVIRNNGQAGIRVNGLTTARNLLAAGSITHNGGVGIFLENGGNGSMRSPVITSATEGEIDAAAPASSLVLFFRDQEDEGEEYFGQAYADQLGRVTFYGSFTGPNITALAVDTTTGTTRNNTSAFSAPFAYSTDLQVTTTSDDGPGSYRAAILRVNNHAGPDKITFAIPASDPGYNPARGTWTIKPTTPLPAITDRQTIVNGSSQKAFIGYDANPSGPEIELDGSLSGSGGGVYLFASACGAVIEGLVINRFANAGIIMYGTDTAQVVGCYIGTDATGLQAAPNYAGIVLTYHARNVTIQSDQTGSGNLISGNTTHGIQINDSCSQIHIIGNTIGLDRTRTKKLGNGAVGIDINMGSEETEVVNNWIGGNGRGLDILTNCHSNTVTNNSIGTDTSCQVDLGNTDIGILISESWETLIEDNRIAYNGTAAVVVSGPTALGNRIVSNRICHHGPPAIITADGGNGEHPCPTITSQSNGVLHGNAQPLDLIIVYTDSSDEGEFILGSTTADAYGQWSLQQMGLLRGPFITATAMDANGNTSCFSAPFDYVAAGVEDRQDPIPGSFALDQNYPNPFNPSTIIRYTIAGAGVQRSGACRTRLMVYDLLGREVVVLVDEKMPPGRYQVTFDATALASGTYIYKFVAGDFVASRKMLVVH
jgi:hypothetical protein